MQFLFGDCALDTAQYELRRGTRAVPTEPQVFDLLVFLIRNHDRVVSKEELLNAVWGGRIVSESTVNNRINAARRAIGDDGDRQQFIRTIPRRGFRFVAAVREDAAEPAAAAASPFPSVIEGAVGEPPAAPVTRPAQRINSRTLSVGGVGLFIGLIAVTTWLLWKDSDPPTASDNSGHPGRAIVAAQSRPSIAVLAFTTQGADVAQGHVAEALVDDIITALSRARNMFV